MVTTYLMSKNDKITSILKNTKTGEVINIVLTDETVVTGYKCSICGETK